MSHSEPGGELHTLFAIRLHPSTQPSKALHTQTHTHTHMLALRSLVLRIVSALPFLPAAAAVRSRLLTDIASGRLLADASDVPPKVGGSAAGPSSAPSAPQTEGSATPAMLPEAIRSLYSHPTGAKLLAMMMASLSLRPSGTVHLPAGEGGGGTWITSC